MKSLLALLILFSSSAFAGYETEQFRETARRVLNQAIKNNLHEVSGVRLKDIVHKLDKIEIKLAQTDAAHRRAAIWQPMKVTFNPNIYNQMPVYAQEVLTVHEVTGATTSSWKDDGYAFALYIWMMAYKSFFQPLHDIFQWPHQVGQTLLAAGGSSVVGGGGDDRDINLKINALLCIRSFLTGGNIPESFKQQSKSKMIRGVLFLNWYTLVEVPEGEMSLHIPLDKSIQPTLILNPKNYNQIVQANDFYTILKLALIFDEKAFTP